MPIAARVSIPVKRLMERTFESLGHAAVSMRDAFGWSAVRDKEMATVRKVRSHWNASRC